MPKLPGISHIRAVKVFEKIGFRIMRRKKHIVMTDGKRILVIPRANPINSFTMAGIVADAGITVEQFKDLL
ncbi:hypothetical protein KAH81_05230 [bacterium]|nr:hypothetical protein [bacterium]